MTCILTWLNSSIGAKILVSATTDQKFLQVSSLPFSKNLKSAVVGKIDELLTFWVYSENKDNQSLGWHLVWPDSLFHQFHNAVSKELLIATDQKCLRVSSLSFPKIPNLLWLSKLTNCWHSENILKTKINKVWDDINSDLTQFFHWFQRTSDNNGLKMSIVLMIFVYVFSANPESVVVNKCKTDYTF